MAKSDMQKQLEADLEKALQENDNSVPSVLTVHDELDTDGNTVLQVDNPNAFDIEYMGIPFVFPLDRLSIMQARALAFNVKLERR